MPIPRDLKTEDGKWFASHSRLLTARCIQCLHKQLLYVRHQRTAARKTQCAGVGSTRVEMFCGWQITTPPAPGEAWRHPWTIWNVCCNSWRWSLNTPRVIYWKVSWNNHFITHMVWGLVTGSVRTMHTHTSTCNKIPRLNFSITYKVYKMHDLTFKKPQPFCKKTKQGHRDLFCFEL